MIAFHGRATGLSAPVGNATASTGETGIGFTVQDGKVIISITRNGHGLAVILRDDDIDMAAGFLADAIIQANQDAAPSIGTMQ